MNILEGELRELEGAEEFLDYFRIDYDPQVVHVNRLHILQRFHDYMQRIALPDEESAQRDVYRQALQSAYRDFVDSDAQTEKVFKVFRQGEPQVAFVSLSEIRRA